MEGKLKLVLLTTAVSVVLIGTVVYFVSNKEEKDNSEKVDSTSITENVKNSDNDKKQKDNDKKQKDNDLEYEKKTTEINVKESSLENELEIGDWGNASKQNKGNLASEYNKIEYIDVPVSVTKITRGEDAEEIVKEWYATKRPNYTYDKPKSDMEWAVIEYKVDLSDVNIREETEGIDIVIKSSLTNEIGGTSINLERRAYLLTSTNMSEDVRVTKSGIYKGQIMAKLPIGFSDYIIQLGSSYDNTKEGNKGTIAYFKGK